jgi:hypothetical protein
MYIPVSISMIHVIIKHRQHITQIGHHFQVVRHEWQMGQEEILVHHIVLESEYRRPQLVTIALKKRTKHMKHNPRV